VQTILKDLSEKNLRLVRLEKSPRKIKVII